jgi:hypothetical protein
MYPKTGATKAHLCLVGRVIVLLALPGDELAQLLLLLLVGHPQARLGHLLLGQRVHVGAVVPGVVSQRRLGVTY